MSGANNQGPPTRLTPIAGDMPIGRTDDGTPIRPSFEFFQCIQRILSYLGQPGQGNPDGTPSSDLTVAEQLDKLANLVANLSASPGTAAPGLDGRISTIESLLRRMPWLLPGRPRKPRQPIIIPAAPQRPQFFYPFLPPPPPVPSTGSGSTGLTQPQVMAIAWSRMGGY